MNSKLRKFFSQSSNGSRGQAMVEFAISMIIVLFLLVAVLDFARAFFSYVQLRDAAQEGAVYGSICPNDFDKISDHVRYSSDFPVDLTDDDHVIVTCTYLNTGNTCGSEAPLPGTGIEVVVTYNDFLITTPLVSGFVGAMDYDGDGELEIQLNSSVEDIILRNEDEGSFQECQ